MEQTAVSLQAMQMLGVKSGRSAMAMAGVTGLGSGQTADPFLAIIENMVAQMLEGQADGDNAVPVLPGLPKAEQDTEDSEQQALLQGFAAMLMADPTLASQLLRQLPPESAADLPPDKIDAALSALTGQPGAALELLSQYESPAASAAENPQPFTLPGNAAPAPQVTEAVSQAAPQLVPQASQMVTQAASPQSQQQPTDAAPPAFTGVVTELGYTETVTQAESPQNQDAFLAQHQFQSAVTQAKRKLQPDPAVDLQELTAVKPTPQTAALDSIATTKAEAPVQEAKVLDQLTTGIRENLAKGSSEFTMKLKPESLGEITVKLMRTAGKMTLSISTASSQTAKLINNDLAALRDAVRPMQVEVHEAVHETPQTSGQMQQPFNQTSQQFSDQRRAFAWQESQQNRHGAPLDEEESFLAQVTSQPTAPNGLNIYV